MFILPQPEDNLDGTIIKIMRSITNITADIPIELKEFIGMILVNGDNNYSRALISGAILNMTHYMYNETIERTDFLPGVPNPF